MATDPDVLAAVAATQASAEAAARAADSARRSLAEATEVLGKVLVQGGTRLDVLDEAVGQMGSLRVMLGDVLSKVDSMATVDDVRGAVAMSAAATRAEQAERRRLTVVRVTATIVWLIVAVVWGVNQQMQHCSPGSKAYRVTSELTNPRESLSYDRLQEAARRPAPTWCDVSLPASAHSPLAVWPTTPNVVGLVLYSAAAAATMWAVRRRSWEHDDPDEHGGVASSA